MGVEGQMGVSSVDLKVQEGGDVTTTPEADDAALQEDHWSPLFLIPRQCERGRFQEPRHE